MGKTKTPAILIAGDYAGEQVGVLPTMNQSATWHSVATLGSIPCGKMAQVVISGHEILLAHTTSGLFATDDLCTHEDASLASGALCGDLVTCPLHGSRFCLRTGQPQEEPAEEALRRYPVRVVAGHIEIQFF